MFIFALKIDQNLNKHGNHKKKRGKKMCTYARRVKQSILEEGRKWFYTPFKWEIENSVEVLHYAKMVFCSWIAISKLALTFASENENVVG